MVFNIIIILLCCHLPSAIRYSQQSSIHSLFQTQYPLKEQKGCFLKRHFIFTICYLYNARAYLRNAFSSSFHWWSMFCSFSTSVMLFMLQKRTVAILMTAMKLIHHNWLKFDGIKIHFQVRYDGLWFFVLCTIYLMKFYSER